MGPKISIFVFFLLAFPGHTTAQEEGFFDHNFAAVGIVQPGTSRIEPEVKAPEKKADQMLQTEAPIIKDHPPKTEQPLQRPKSYPGRFVNTQGGVRERRVPERLGEVGTDLP